MAADTEGQWYAGRIVEDDGRLLFLAWRRSRDNRFVGGLSAPLEIDVDEHGQLSVGLDDL